MTTELVEHLRPARECRYVDATAGAGGHTEAILRASDPDGRVLCLDADYDAVQRLGQKLEPFGDRALYQVGNFADIAAHAAEAEFVDVAGVIFDLGFSSYQIDDCDRGFSFQLEGPLDMRYDRSAGPTAAEIVAQTSQKQLADIIFEFGEERRSRKIAREIVARREQRPITTTADLAGIVARAHGGRRGHIHPATRTFQALRIYVNQELDNLSAGLAGALELLVEGGRIVVISFHSLEDRIVKNFFRDHMHSGRLEILTPKPLQPGPNEIASNPRSRSAKLRAARVVG